MIFAAGWKPGRAVALFDFAALCARDDALAGARFVVVDGWEGAFTGRGGLKEGPFLRAAFVVAFFGGISVCI
jgi:hypothetical protein